MIYYGYFFYWPITNFLGAQTINKICDFQINNLMGKTSTASNIQQPVNNMASMRNGFASSPLFNHLLNKNASPPATSATSSSSPQAQQNALALAVAHMVQANPSVTNYFPPFAAANAAFMAHLAGMSMHPSLFGNMFKIVIIQLISRSF